MHVPLIKVWKTRIREVFSRKWHVLGYMMASSCSKQTLPAYLQMQRRLIIPPPNQIMLSNAGQEKFHV
jgi:hypothetical protein